MSNQTMAVLTIPTSSCHLARIVKSADFANVPVKRTAMEAREAVNGIRTKVSLGMQNTVRRARTQP